MKKNQLMRKLLLLSIIFMTASFCFAQVTRQWVARYNGPGNFEDQSKSMAVDSLGNVYVTGKSLGAADYDYATIKYNKNGIVLWVKRYSGPVNEFDVARSIAVDRSGNVYVTGQTEGREAIAGDDDYATIKYDTNGNLLWVRMYNGPANGNDDAKSVAVDAAGNVYVTGQSQQTPGPLTTPTDYATIKYNSAGVQLWVARYNGPGNGEDVAYKLVVDASGNVYVSGWSIGLGTNYDYATIKYNSAGIQQWVRRYNGTANAMDFVGSLAVDAGGNVYVTGQTAEAGTRNDYTTIKYNSAGELKWLKKYNGTGGVDDGAGSVAVDIAGNVYVTGASMGNGTNYDYATIKYNSLGTQLWVARYNGPAKVFDGANSLALDASGNVYVTGRSTGIGTRYDYATIKYNAAGIQQWVERYVGPDIPGDGDEPRYDAIDNAVSIIVDGSGNVYVTGESDGSGTNLDYATIKYSQPPAIAARAVPAKLSEELPSVFRVSNYPNPVSYSTRIQFELPIDGQVSVKVYDVLGREVATLVNANMKAGYHSTDFKASSFQQGMYYYTVTLNAANKVVTESRKIIVVK